MKGWSPRFTTTVSLAFAFVLFADATLLLLPRSTVLAVLGKRGPMDLASVGLYVAGAIWFGAAPRGERGGRSVRGALLLLVLAAMELGLVDWFPPLRKGRNLPPADPRLVAAGVALILILLVAVVIPFLRRRWPRLRAGLRDRREAAGYAVLGVALIPVIVLLDRIQTAMTWERGFRTARFPSFHVGLVEETLELLIPIFFLAALAAAAWERRGRGQAA